VTASGLRLGVVAHRAVIGYKDPDELIKLKSYVVLRVRSGDDALARDLQKVRRLASN
jgi:hypothetical protein